MRLLGHTEMGARGGNGSSRLTEPLSAAVLRWAVPALVLALLVDLAVLWLRRHLLADDATINYLPAARDFLHGRSPYRASEVAGGAGFGSPPIAAFAYAPFLVFPSEAGEVLIAVLALTAVLGSLRLVGVRDWRCYAIATLSYPVLNEFQTANVSALLALSAAVVWRYRDRKVAAGAAAGANVALKLFGWPLVLFLLVTKRFKAAAIAAASAVALIVLPWAAVGFAGARGYPHFLHLLMDAQRGEAYSIGRLLVPHVSWTGAELVTWAIVLALVAAAWRTERQEVAFAYCAAAAITCSPIVWPHYLILLLLALGIARPTFGFAWLLPLVPWLSPHAHAVHPWQAAVALVAEAALLAVVVRGAPSRAAATHV